MFVLPEDVKNILKTLNNAGHSAYVVGGCVRDCLMGKIPVDWDITTSAEPHEVKAAFQHTVDTGIEHGTVTVVIDQKNYEVTTFRIDGTYKDARRPEAVEFTTDLEMDLARRDFTMNAIAYNPAMSDSTASSSISSGFTNSNSGLVDPFGGVEDICRKNIRCVGDPSLRFDEDALRMMRAIRFSAQLSFEIDKPTYNAIHPLAEKLALISMERIREELTKILVSPNPGALQHLSETGLWKHILRGHSYEGDLSCGDWLKKCPKDPAMLYGLLMHKPACESSESMVSGSMASGSMASWYESFMRHLKFDNRTIKEAAIYASYLDADNVNIKNERIDIKNERMNMKNERYNIKKTLNAIGSELFENLLILHEITRPQKSSHYKSIHSTYKDIIKSGECFCIKNLAVNGQDLINAGIAPGETMGKIMDDLLDKVMADPSLNQKELLLKLILYNEIDLI